MLSEMKPLQLALEAGPSPHFLLTPDLPPQRHEHDHTEKALGSDHLLLLLRRRWCSPKHSLMLIVHSSLCKLVQSSGGL